MIDDIVSIYNTTDYTTPINYENTYYYYDEIVNLDKSV